MSNVSIRYIVQCFHAITQKVMVLVDASKQGIYTFCILASTKKYVILSTYAGVHVSL